jgi:hypothetical protein
MYRISSSDYVGAWVALTAVFGGLACAGYYGGTPAVLAALVAAFGLRMAGAIQRRVVFDYDS